MSSVEVYGKLSANMKINHSFRSQTHKEIHAITKSIKQLYETLQVIINNKDNTSNAFSDLIDEDMTSIFPECSP